VIAAQPVLTESYMGYSAGMTGLIMASRGVCSAIAMMTVAGLIKRVDPRILVLLGVIFTAIGTWMMSNFTLTSSFYYMSLAGAWQGLGMGLFFVPLSVITFNTLSPEGVPVAAGLFSFGRSLGSSIGISIITTLLARETQINWNRLGGHINIFNPNLQAWFLKRNWTLTNPLAIHALASQLASQAAMIGFIDIFWAATIGVLLMIPLVLIMKRPVGQVELGAGH
jgi:MFS transporter, DHA2 family, multidrug resistance protein